MAGQRVKLLKAPYGHGSGDHVSFRHSGPFVPGAIAEVLEGYSCWPPVIPRVLACLEASGRYDCVLQSVWFRAQDGDFCRALARVGMTVEIFELDPHHKGKLRHAPFI